MRIMDASLKLSKFRGSFLGVLLGDCCGAPFEGDDIVSSEKLVLKKYFDTLEGPFFKAPQKAYTDDTAMTKSVAQTLINHRSIDQTDLATNFVKSYFKEPRRGYGAGVIEVFHKLRINEIGDPLGPAKEQFEGTGSYGNGGAMRIAPLSLFYHNKSTDELVDLAKKSAEITHTHRQGINGAVLQALAVHAAFNSDPKEELDTQAFVQNLQNKMSIVEEIDEGLGLDDPAPFVKQLQHVSRLLEKQIEPSDQEIVNVLGNNVAALYSVPTAIYCFLRSQKEIKGIHTSNPFRRAIEYAISLGGDTDTIASMAGAISGAYHGDSVLPENLLKHCEAHVEMIALADSLYKTSNSL